MPLKDVVELVTKKPVPSAQKYLIFEMILTDLETDEELEIPYLRFKISP
jgi:ubiquitin-activating enzyme E1